MPSGTYRPGRRGRGKALVVALGVFVAACTGTATTSTSAPAGTSTTTSTIPPATTTTVLASTTTTTATVIRDVTLEVPVVSDVGDEWVEAFLIPYGPDEQNLGTSRGGIDGLRDVGPEYGAQAADGSWWFADTAKFRFAHYTEEGDYIEQVPIPAEFLSEGKYFPYQLLHIMDDGTLTMIWQDYEASRLLVYDGDFRLVDAADGPFGSIYNDGQWLYGYTEDGALGRVDPLTGVSEIVDWFETRSGTRLGTFFRDDKWLIDLPDATVPLEVSIETVYAADPARPVIAVTEHQTGEDGTVFILFYGTTFEGDSPQLGGFITISPDGDVSELEPIRDPFSDADPGSPAHLGIRPGTSTPWLVFVDTDGVRVFTRQGS